jgi:D-alanyl-D-alanine carboxypeptidase
MLACAFLAGSALAEEKVKAPPKPTLAEVRANAIVATVPSVNALSALIMDRDSGRILWSKDADAKRYPASTTKILTALLLLENTQPTDLITAPLDIEKTTGSSLHLKPYESVNAHDMLYALMMRSANDGCEAVARHISGTADAFAELMTKRAKEIGCTNSHFANPHGLHNEEHYTTAHDLALIAREAMKNPSFREAVDTQSYTIVRSINQADCLIKNHDRLLEFDSSVNGIKTGWTNPAGRCFVGSIERNGLKLITVVLRSDDWMADTTRLNEWACAHLQKSEMVSPNQAVEPVPVQNGVRGTIKAVAAESIEAVVPRTGDLPQLETVVDPKIHAPIKKGQRLGMLVAHFDDGTELRSPILADENMEAKPAMLASLMNPGTMLIAGIFVLSYAFLRRRSRTMVRR